MSCQASLEDGRFKAEHFGSRDLGKTIILLTNQGTEKRALSGSTQSISAKHLVRSPSPNEQRDMLKNQWRLSEP